MSSGFQNPITIKDAIDKIHSRQFLLPAIQRKFTWSSSQIEMLFDSILRGYIVRVHFSETAKETMEDKIKRMLREEVRKM